MRLRNRTQLVHRALLIALLSTPFVGPARGQGRVGPAPGPAFALFRPAPYLPLARPVSASKDPDDQQRKGVPWEEIVGVVLVVLTVGALIGFFFQPAT